MDDTIVYTLLHDLLGDAGQEALHHVLNKLTAKELVEDSYKDLHHKVSDISLDKWEAWKKYFSIERYNLRKQYLINEGIHVILFGQQMYPDSLKVVYRPPAILYLKGNLPQENLSIAIVGSRRATNYGKNVAYSLAKALSENHVTIVSGLAKGIDVNAHLGALDGKHGGTIAILGCGIDVIYPKINREAFQKILQAPNGAILSEWPIGSNAITYHFPQRNRIIAGLSEGVVVVEASNKSGSLITANYALDYGKDVFAVPGLITSSSSVGCHRLIKDGAKLVSNPSDILSEYGQLTLFREEKKVNNEKDNLTSAEKSVLEVLDIIPKNIEEICRACNLSLQEVNSILLTLELKDMVVQHYGREYSVIEI